MPSIETLIDDIHSILDPDVDHIASEENLELLATAIKDSVRDRLRVKPPGSALRFSSIGKPDRQVYLAAKGVEAEKLSPQTMLKFQFGDLYEALLLFLAREAGHSVTNEQGTVEVEGVLGHMDAEIDGHVVDVKSASPFSFKKFQDASLLYGDDPFGYVNQLSGYATASGSDNNPYFFAVEKVMGSLALLEIPKRVVSENPPAERIAHLKGVIDSNVPPEKCYEDVPMGKSGNRRLATGCSYCAFKRHCWPGLRAFGYSSGPVYLSQVVEVPKVPEIPL